MSKTQSDPNNILDWLLKEGIDVITQPEETEYLPTSSLRWDWILGGGIPKGRFSVCWGSEGAGKTTLALLACKSAITQNLRVGYLDVEAALDPIWASRFGLSLESGLDMKDAERLFWLIQPHSAEAALNAISKMTRLRDPRDQAKPAFGLIVLDSIAALATEAELAGEVGDQVVAGVARVLGQFFRANKTRLADSGTAVLLLNQERSRFGQSWGHGQAVEMPGGKAVKFYASVIMRMSTKPKPVILKDTGEVIGLQMRVKTQKNKTSRPGREAEFTVYIDQGEADIFDELAALGKEFNIFTREDGSPISGGGYWHYRIDNGMRKIAIGQAAVAAALDADRDLAAEVEAIIRLRIANMNRGEPHGMIFAGDDGSIDAPDSPPDDAPELAHEAADL